MSSLDMNSKRFNINFQFPIIYYEENLYFKKDKSCWAVYKIEGFSYDFKSFNEKISKLNSLTRMFWELKLEGHVKIIPVLSSLSEDNDKLKQSVTGPLKVQAIKDIDLETQDLAEYLGDEGNEYEYYIVVKLERPKAFFKKMKEYAKSLYQDPIRFINEYAGLEDPEIFLREVESYKSFEEIAYARISKYQGIKRADEQIIQYLIKQPLYFGIGNPPIRGDKIIEKRFRKDKSKAWKPHADIIERHGEKMIRPHTKDVLTLGESEINISFLRRIEVTQFLNGRETTALQAYITIASIPDLTFPGGEWLYDLLSNTKFPITVSMRFKSIEYKAGLTDIRRKQQDLADIDQHIRQSDNAVPIDVMESSEEAYTMEYDLKNRKYPLLNTTIVIGVAARDKETLNKRIEAIRNHFNDIQTEVPAGDQWLLFNESLLGGEQYANSYALRLTPEHFAAAMVGATKQIGDETGPYIAITGILKKPVRIDLKKPGRVNKASNVSTTGSQGGGKSFTADLITCKTVKYCGAKAVIIDPKGDRTYWEHELKSFNGHIKVTTFSGDEKDKGKLDPFNIMKYGITKDNYIEKMKEAAGLAVDIGMFLIAADRKDPRTRHLLTAVNRVTNKPIPAMTKIIAELKIMAKEAEEEEDLLKKNMCIDIADTLYSYKQMAYSSLLFGDGDEEAVNLEKSINVLQIQNLVFPKEGTAPENYSFQEIIGYACLLAISGYIMTFIMSDRGTLKIFELDEATVLNSTPSGKSVINKLQRMSRALNSPGIFIGQSVDDLGDERFRNNVGYKFAFRSTDEKEINKILNFFKLEPTAENINVIENLSNGVALFQDLEGRTGVIAIDAIFEEYINAFDTKPESMEKKKRMYLGV